MIEVHFIRQKIFLREIYFILLVCLIVTTFNFSVNAEEEIAEISIIGTPTYELINQNAFGETVVSRYIISISFENKGNISSDLIEVNLSDQEGFVLTKFFTIDPSENKVITFNWSTIYTNNQQLNINYHPADLEALGNQYNSGKTTFILKVALENNDSSTPGFVIVTIESNQVVLHRYWFLFDEERNQSQ